MLICLLHYSPRHIHTYPQSFDYPFQHRLTSNTYQPPESRLSLRMIALGLHDKPKKPSIRSVSNCHCARYSITGLCPSNDFALHSLNRFTSLANPVRKQMWVETPKGKGKKPVNKDRFISYVFFYPLLSSSLLLEINSVLLRDSS